MIYMSFYKISNVKQFQLNNQPCATITNDNISKIKLIILMIECRFSELTLSLGAELTIEFIMGVYRIYNNSTTHVKSLNWNWSLVTNIKNFNIILYIYCIHCTTL